MPDQYGNSTFADRNRNRSSGQVADPTPESADDDGTKEVKDDTPKTETKKKTNKK